MDSLKEMIRNYTIRHDTKLKAICAPLKTYLGISCFSYYTLDLEGNITNLGNHAESLDFFYQEKFYLENTFCCHPHLLRSGNVWMPTTYYSPSMKDLFTQCRVGHSFLMLQRYEKSVEGAFFMSFLEDKLEATIFYKYRELMRRFIAYFKKETNPLIERMKHEKFNIKAAKGQSFLEILPTDPLSNRNPKVNRFLQLLNPLTSREQQCLEMYQQGHSAQTTGAILDISSRTVEAHFEHIKDKLGCPSKAALLEW